MNGEYLLEVQELSAAYGRVEAVRDVTLQIAPGQIVTVIGPNGAGKSTTLAALMGLLPLTAGRVLLSGEPLQHIEVEERVGLGMNLVPESRALFAQMSVQDNLLMGAYSRHRQGHRNHQETMESVYATFPRLKERRTQLAGTLSGGERQMLAIGRALMAKPRLLMLDEPSLGLAPLIVREIFQVVSRLRDLGVSILLVEQNACAALEIADYGYVLELGEITLEGPGDQLADNPRVVASYLGGGNDVGGDTPVAEPVLEPC
jgi:branched-chain amino acid transport system ATP-binding protein